LPVNQVDGVRLWFRRFLIFNGDTFGEVFMGVPVVVVGTSGRRIKISIPAWLSIGRNGGVKAIDGTFMVVF
jgi:hypothetical protein